MIDLRDLAFNISNKTGLSYWRGKPIIALDEWIRIRNTAHALDYFPDDFDHVLTQIPEDEAERNQEVVKEWDSEFLELMEYTKNPGYAGLGAFTACLVQMATTRYLLELIGRLPKD